jgi:curved DNA-binding protein CbpA
MKSPFISPPINQKLNTRTVTSEVISHMASSKTLYSIFGVSPDADASTIKRAYHELAMKWHPDKNPGNVEMAEAKLKAISEAYDVLCDPEQRSEYNRTLGAQEVPRPSAPTTLSPISPEPDPKPASGANAGRSARASPVEKRCLPHWLMFKAFRR